MPTWPASLPQTPLVKGYSEAMADTNVLRTQMDVGPAKRRRRSTATPVNFDVRMYLTASEVSTLQTFYVDTLREGTLSFDIDHPRTGATVTMAFREPYTLEARSGKFLVSLKLEKLP